MRFACPRCERSIEQSGEVTIDAMTFPVFQCDECLIEAEMFGERVEVAYTFALDAQGRVFDPADQG